LIWRIQNLLRQHNGGAKGAPHVAALALDLPRKSERTLGAEVLRCGEVYYRTHLGCPHPAPHLPLPLQPHPQSRGTTLRGSGNCPRRSAARRAGKSRERQAPCVAHQSVTPLARRNSRSNTWEKGPCPKSWHRPAKGGGWGGWDQELVVK